VITAIVVVGGLGLTVVGVCQRRIEDTRVRDAALPRCVERLHDEQDCRRRIEIGHADCATYARTFPGKGQGGRSTLDPDHYLECVLLSPSGWVEKKGRERAEREAERARDLSGH